MKGADYNNCIEKAVDVLAKGGIILVPTDTVWGLMCDCENIDAIDSIFKMKKSKIKPLAVLCDSLECIENLDVELSTDAKAIIDAFWPGMLTIILKSRSDRFRYVMGSKKSIGVRIPNSQELTGLIRQYGKPLAATSANISGWSPPRTIEDIPDYIQSKVDYICRFNINPSGNASTVINCVSGEVKLIREGIIKFKNILQITGNHD
ncbi:MAG: threonylcarbamoyl-AMP synthase [candidate division Zixibacteria bacterium]|nr:threonylcarbamoyl-AMP synthase [candidate division Zixibacteria bacterium]